MLKYITEGKLYTICFVPQNFPSPSCGTPDENLPSKVLTCTQAAVVNEMSSEALDSHKNQSHL